MTGPRRGQTSFGEAEGRLGGLLGPPGPPRPPKSAFSKIPLNLIIIKTYFGARKGSPLYVAKKLTNHYEVVLGNPSMFWGLGFCFCFLKFNVYFYLSMANGSWGQTLAQNCQKQKLKLKFEFPSKAILRTAAKIEGTGPVPARSRGPRPHRVPVRRASCLARPPRGCYPNSYRPIVATWHILSGSLATRYSDFSGFRTIFGQTSPQNPSRTKGLVLQCRLHQNSAPQTNSKAM